MGSVEAELWNIFTYYTLHGNALDPEHLALTQMVQLARDVQVRVEWAGYEVGVGGRGGGLE